MAGKVAPASSFQELQRRLSEHCVHDKHVAIRCCFGFFLDCCMLLLVNALQSFLVAEIPLAIALTSSSLHVNQERAGWVGLLARGSSVH